MLQIQNMPQTDRSCTYSIVYYRKISSMLIDWAEYVKMFILKVMEVFNVYGWQTTFLGIFICSKSI